MFRLKVIASLVLFLFVGFLMTQGAMGALVSSQFAPTVSYPKIGMMEVTSAGYFKYEFSDKKFSMESEATNIAIGWPWPVYSLSGVNYQSWVNFSIDLDNGSLQPGGFYVGNLGQMSVYVKQGSVSIPPWNYSSGTTLLSGTVWAFGYYDADAGVTAAFDFLLTNLSGVLVTNHGWPTNVMTYVYSYSENSWPGNFGGDFTVQGAKGWMGPSNIVPIPASLLLLGTGLSLVGFLRFRRK